jgi:UDP-N-acetyl-2-amino-2-deoxyglucuronate dehydrogenase
VVCHQKRFHPHIQNIHSMIQEGALGKLVYAELSMMLNRDDDYYNAAPWRGSLAMDGGMLLNQGIHNIDLLVWFMGIPETVYGKLTWQLRSTETEDTAAAVLTSADGSIATISATVCAAPTSTLEQISLYGTRGAIVLAGKWFDQVIRWDVDGLEPPSVPPFDAYDGLYQDFCHAVTHQEQPLVNGVEGYKTLQTILAIYQSHVKREPIQLPIHDFSVAQMRDALRGDSDV